MAPKSWSSSKENLSRRFHVNTGLLGRSGDFLPRGNFCRTSKYPLLVSYLSRRVGFQLFLLYRGSTFSISHCVRVSYMSILINDWYNILIMINLPFNCFFTTGVNFLIQSLHKWLTKTHRVVKGLHIGHIGFAVQALSACPLFVFVSVCFQLFLPQINDTYVSDSVHSP